VNTDVRDRFVLGTKSCFVARDPVSPHLFVNVILRAINPKFALSARELITIWAIMAAASGIPSTGMMRHALRPLVAYKYFATLENDWEALFHQYIPEWRVVRDESAIKSFYEGISPGEPH